MSTQNIADLATKIREEFDKVAKEDKLVVNQIGDVIKNLGLTEYEDQLQEIITKAELKDDSKIGFDKFISIYNDLTNDKLSRDDFIAAVRVFDQNNDGKLTKEEFTMMLDNLGEAITQEDMNEILQLSDPKNENAIPVEFIVDMLTK